MRYLLTLMIALFGFSSVLFAFEQPLKNAMSEKHAHEIFKSLRCKMCEGQSVLDSDSDFAKSVRQLVREKLDDGLDDEQIYDMLKNNYGSDIMFRPPFDEHTAILWLLPFIMIFAGFMVVIKVLRKNRTEIYT